MPVAQRTGAPYCCAATCPPQQCLLRVQTERRAELLAAHSGTGKAAVLHEHPTQCCAAASVCDCSTHPTHARKRHNIQYTRSGCQQRAGVRWYNCGIMASVSDSYIAPPTRADAHTQTDTARTPPYSLWRGSPQMIAMPLLAPGRWFCCGSNQSAIRILQGCAVPAEPT